MDEMIKAINKYPNGTILVIKWENNLVIKGKLDTIYETDNGKELDSNEFVEFYTCLIMINEILSIPNKGTELLPETFIEVSMQNPPSQITLENGLLVWQIK